MGKIQIIIKYMNNKLIKCNVSLEEVIIHRKATRVDHMEAKRGVPLKRWCPHLGNGPIQIKRSNRCLLNPTNGPKSGETI
jgi:hypothetical protein